MSRPFGALLIVLLVFLVGCTSSDDGDSTADMIPDVDGIVVPWPTFTSDRPDPVEGELYIVGELITPQILLIHLEMIYPASRGFPRYLLVRLTMPDTALLC